MKVAATFGKEVVTRAPSCHRARLMGQTKFFLTRFLVPFSCLVACEASTQSPQSPQSPQSSQSPPADDGPSPEVREALKSLPSPGPPALLQGRSWDCPFPPAADAARIDQAVASVTVAINANGIAEWAKVIEDPGYNFGAAAASCAMKRQYAPARDAQGRPIWAVTPPIRVRFTR